MSLYVTSLNSGSNGNCYYIGNDDEAILVDAGISCREIEKRMKRLNLSIKKLKAVFISHEHTDHIKGIAVLSKKYKLPVYVTSQTYQYSRISLESSLNLSFKPFEPISIGKLEVTAFPKFHDAVDPHSFIVSCDNVNVGVFTDIGVCCEQVIQHFKLCNAAFLEANYCERLLEQGNYPYFLKNRIRGGRGHLSNVQALEIFTKNRPPNLSHLFLSHLSKDNNCPDLVSELFKQYAEDTKIVVASRFSETEVYYISNDIRVMYDAVQRHAASTQLQLTL